VLWLNKAKWALRALNIPGEGKGCLVTYRMIGQCEKLRIVRYIIALFQTDQLATSI